MIICRVVGHVWSTKKEETLNGMKLMVVQQTDERGDVMDDLFVAADIVGAGIGEQVLVVSGSTARRAFGGDNLPIDAAIVGIIDSVEVDKQPSREELLKE